MLGSILGAVLPSVVGGLFASGENRRARRDALHDDATRFTRLREGAEAAGFNPLTALMYGGTSSALPPTAPLSVSSFVQQGFRDATAEITGEAANQRAQDALRTRLMQLQVEREAQDIQAFNASQALGAARSGAARTRTAAASDDEPRSIRAAGRDIGYSADWDDAQEAQDRWGDLVEAVYGAGVFAADVGPHISRGIDHVFNVRAADARSRHPIDVERGSAPRPTLAQEIYDLDAQDYQANPAWMYRHELQPYLPEWFFNRDLPSSRPGASRNDSRDRLGRRAN